MRPRRSKTKAGRAWLLSEPERNALLRNTITPTVLQGSEKTNIIPQEASVELDIRLLPDEDTVAFRRTLERLIADPKIRIESIGDMAPPLQRAARHRDVPRHRAGGGTGPAGSAGGHAGERRRQRPPLLGRGGPHRYGIDPWLVELEESRHSVHGNDERLSLENIEFGLKYYVGVILEMEGGGRAVGR